MKLCPGCWMWHSPSTLVFFKMSPDNALQDYVRIFGRWKLKRDLGQTPFNIWQEPHQASSEMNGNGMRAQLYLRQPTQVSHIL